MTSQNLVFFDAPDFDLELVERTHVLKRTFEYGVSFGLLVVTCNFFGGDLFFSVICERVASTAL